MDNKLTKTNFMEVSKDVLEFQLKALYPVQNEPDPIRINIIFLNHDRNFSTFLTIRDLVEHERIADIYTLSRSMFESVINMGLLAKHLIMDEIEKYQNFQFIESYKTYNHLKDIGLEYLSGIPSSDEELLNKKREEYIRKWGNNLFSWSGRNLLQNVRLIDENYPPTCDEKHFYEYLYCQVYRKGSQSVHSSFAGLSKGINIEGIQALESINVQRFKANEGHLTFSCFHALLVFISSVRFLGHVLDKEETESYFHDIAQYVISDK